MLSPTIKDKFEDKLKLFNLKYVLLINDVSYYIKQQSYLNNNGRHQRSANLLNYNKYNDLNTINKWMDKILLKHSDIVEIFEVAKSFEGKSIRMFKISTSFEKKKPAIWIDGILA